MSRMNAGAQDGETLDEEVDTLSTGLENLDFAFEDQGLPLGTLVSVLSDSNSPGDVVTANMIANRPAYYYTLGRSAEHIEQNIKDIPNVDLNTTYISEVDSTDPVGTLLGVLENTDYPRGATIIIDPVNVLESVDYNQFKELLRELQSQVNDKDGIGILYGVNGRTESEHRWFTMSACDTVFEIIHEQNGESVDDYLTVQKMYPGQELVNDDTRKFQLDRSLDIDITTSRNISP